MWATGRESFGDFGGGGAGGGGGGGGFVPNAGGGGGDTGEKKMRGKNIVPVTIRQLLDCKDDALKIEDMEANTVTVVGLVRHVETSTTKISFVLDDQTGVIEAIQYVGTDGDGILDTNTILVEGTYGRVVGGLRTHNKGEAGRKYIVIHKVMPVTDLNELTCHMLEVFQVPIKLKKIREAQNAKINGATGAGMNNTITSSLFGTSFGDTTMGAGGGGGRPSGGNLNIADDNVGMGNGFTANQNLVLNIIKSCRTETGLHKNEIMQNIKGKLNLKEVESVIEFLSGEGHIFSTVDDDHLKVTDWINPFKKATIATNKKHALVMALYKDLGAEIDDVLANIQDVYSGRIDYHDGIGHQLELGNPFRGTEENVTTASFEYKDSDNVLLHNQKKFNMVPIPGSTNTTRRSETVGIIYGKMSYTEQDSGKNQDGSVFNFAAATEVGVISSSNSMTLRSNLRDEGQNDFDNTTEVVNPNSNADHSPNIVVKPLIDSPENIRWMYKSENDKAWIPFLGYDSIRLETQYQEIKHVLKNPYGIRSATAVSDSAITSTANIANSVSSTTEATATPSTSSINNPGNPLPFPKSTIMTELLNNSERRFSLVNKSIFSNDNSTFSPSFGWKQKKMSGTSGNVDKNNDPSSSALSRMWFNPWSNTNNVGDPNLTEPTGIEQTSNDQELKSNPATNDHENWLQGKDLTKPPKHIVIVRSGLYEADFNTWQCKSTFWPGDISEITRGTWFHEGTWEPIVMDHAEQLEQEHLDKFAETPLTSSVFPLFHSLPESPTRKIKTVAHRVTFPEYHIDWTGPTDIHLYRKRSSSFFMKSMSQKLGFQWGERISRGYFKPATINDKPPEIGHVVFVVHGIGQKMDTGRIVRNCSTFRETVDGIQRKYFNDDGNNDSIAIFFPIEWRSSLRLDGDIVDTITPNKILGLRQLLNTTAMDIMYYTSPLYRTEIQSALRDELNRTYKNFMIRNPKFEANGGKFSILAHSLGAVITYDIITCPLLRQPDDWPEGQIENRLKHRVDTASGENTVAVNESLKDPESNELKFHLEHFFCLGSPLSVFLALRWREPTNPLLRPYILPDRLCRRMYNIFDLNDPVAYRLEPLLNKNYVSIPPVAIINHNAPPQVKYDEIIREIVNKDLIPPIENNYINDSYGVDTIYDSASLRNYFFDTNSNSDYQLRSPPAHQTPQTSAALRDSFFSAIYNYWNHKQAASQLPDEPNEMEVAAAKLDSLSFTLSSLDEEVNSTTTSDDCPDSMSMNIGSDSFMHSASAFSPISDFTSPSESISQGEHITSLPHLPHQPIPNDLDYRIDYVMRESNLPIPTGYLAALTSHTSYWSSPDIGYFVLSHLYNRIPDERRDNNYSSPQ